MICSGGGGPVIVSTAGCPPAVGLLQRSGHTSGGEWCVAVVMISDKLWPSESCWGACRWW
jgi:hypothetical protein